MGDRTGDTAETPICGSFIRIDRPVPQSGNQLNPVTRAGGGNINIHSKCAALAPKNWSSGKRIDLVNPPCKLIGVLLGRMIGSRPVAGFIMALSNGTSCPKTRAFQLPHMSPFYCQHLPFAYLNSEILKHPLSFLLIFLFKQL
jgi:hypothetical protein